MTKVLAVSFFLLSCIGSVLGQNTVIARGNPNLTQPMIDKLESVYSRLLDIRLDSAQKVRFRKGVIEYWTSNNTEGIRTSEDNLKYYDSPEQINELKSSSQASIVEGLRRDIANTSDPVSVVLVEAFDRAHPNMSNATRMMAFADLVGTWKRSDALGARIDPSGRASGVSFTDSGTIEIQQNGSFGFVKVHNNCSGGCCRLDGSEEFGSISIVAGNLVLQTNRGSKLTEDGCLHAKQRTQAKPHRESFAWSVRTNPNSNAPTLCLTSAAGESSCYDKQ
ncbi:MAG: hypothetical protein DMF63_02180 [Acidobacteria bacterium]|nr:MAG: hypothetical protein DMF63_02180 [Acidobacteriota bacterium]